MKKYLCISLLVLLNFTLFSCKPQQGNNSKNKQISKDIETTFKWSNPMKYPVTLNNGLGYRDPFIVKEGEWYYLIGTQPPYFEQDQGVPDVGPKWCEGVNIHKSKDLKNWEFVCDALKRPDPAENKWYQNYFWAPELFIHNGKYYVTVSCSKNGHYENKGKASQQGIALLVADKIEGPYKMLTEESPLLYSNDAHLFVDDDGMTYMYASGIVGFSIDLDNAKIIGSIKNIINTTNDAKAWDGTKSGLEGPFVRKIANTYYLFYSAWARGYEIGIATAEKPLGPWKKQKLPFYGAMNEEACNRNNIPFESSYYLNNFVEAGHNSVFQGPDGRDWIVAHAFQNGDKQRDVKMVFDPLEIRDDKLVVIDAATNEPVNGPTMGDKTVYISNAPDPVPLKALDSWVNIKIDSEFDLPQKADILFENGWRECKPVTWDKSINTSSAGEQVINGTISINDKIFTCKLTATIK